MPGPRPRTVSHLTGIAPEAKERPPADPTATVIIPTIADSATLSTVIQGWKWQRQPVRILIVDTGSNAANYSKLLNAHEGKPNIEIAHIANRPWNGQSARVAAALDLATALCETPYAILTHDDVFPKLQTLQQDLEYELNVNGTVAAGYQMSSRSNVTEQWRGMVSHTLTILNVHDVRAHNLRWSMTGARKMPDCENHGPAWPDTETGFGLRCKQLGITPRLFANETNEPHFEDQRIVHRRSLTSHRYLYPQLADKDLEWQDTTTLRFMELYNGH